MPITAAIHSYAFRINFHSLFFRKKMMRTEMVFALGPATDESGILHKLILSEMNFSLKTGDVTVMPAGSPQGWQRSGILISLSA
jgi:hypothetical protein